MSLFSDAKLILTPNGYKDGKIYALKPFDGSGDFDVVRATSATRVNSAGLIESVGNNIIRLDYTEDSCPCILVEPQRTNLLLHSENFDISPWFSLIDGDGLNPIITPNSGVSPDGSFNATRIVFQRSTNNTSNYSLRRQNISSINNGVGSIYIKSYTGSDYNIDFRVAGIEKSFIATNDWVRISDFETTAIHFQIGIRLQSSGLFADVLVWGAQLEQGTEATSYIPTTTSTVTRNADVATVTPPAGVTEIIETFEDNSVNVITTIPSTYQLPIGRIKHIVMK